MSTYPSDYSAWSRDKQDAFYEQIRAQKQSNSSYFIETPVERPSNVAGKAARPAPEPLPLAPPMQPGRPYPIAALGPVLSDAATSIAAKCQCSSALAAQSVLAVASLASQPLADVLMPYGQTRPLSLFFVTIAASGDRKSTADNEALIPVKKRERNLRESYGQAFQAWKVSYAAWDAERRKIETNRNQERLSREAELTALGPPPMEPIRPLLIAPEPTVEALAKHWPVMPGSLGLFSAEGGQMTGGHGFGPDHRLKTAAALSSVWDGNGIRRLRAGDGITDLPGRRLALHLMVQPNVAAAFLSEPILRDQGLLSRLLLASPESIAGRRMWQEPAAHLEASMERYTIVMLKLLEKEAPAANKAGNELSPRALEFSAGAKAAWVVFYNKIEGEMAEDRSLEGIRDVAGKAAENAARIAAVLTITGNPDACTIEVSAMNAACELMAWYVAEALRLAGQHRLPPSLRNAIKLLDWLHTKDKTETTRSEIMQFGPGAVRTKAEAEAAIGQLEEYGWLIPLVVEGRQKWTVIKKATQ